ncbi:MAG: hypothetical protein ABFD59_08320 [Smithella sp.]
MLLAAFVFAGDELTLSQGWTYSKSGRTRVLSTTGVKYGIAGAGVVENVQVVSTNTVGDALTLGGVTTPGFAWFKNLSTNHYIEIGLQDSSTNFVSFIKLNTNQAQACWLSVAAPYARGNGATVQLDYMICDR